MPCIENLMDGDFDPIEAPLLAFVDAVVALAPSALAPLRTQLNTARARDDGFGWIVVRDVAAGTPVDWPEGVPFDVLPSEGRTFELGPNGCHDLMLWFLSDGRLLAFEFINLEYGSIDVPAFTAWLSGIADLPSAIESAEARRVSERLSWNASAPA